MLKLFTHPRSPGRTAFHQGLCLPRTVKWRSAGVLRAATVDGKIVRGCQDLGALPGVEKGLSSQNTPCMGPRSARRDAECPSVTRVAVNIRPISFLMLQTQADNEYLYVLLQTPKHALSLHH
jgi:hypothetical protein